MARPAAKPRVMGGWGCAGRAEQSLSTHPRRQPRVVRNKPWPVQRPHGCRYGCVLLAGSLCGLEEARAVTVWSAHLTTKHCPHRLHHQHSFVGVLTPSLLCADYSLRSMRPGGNSLLRPPPLQTGEYLYDARTRALSVPDPPFVDHMTQIQPAQNMDVRRARRCVFSPRPSIAAERNCCASTEQRLSDAGALAATGSQCCSPACSCRKTRGKSERHRMDGLQTSACATRRPHRLRRSHL